MNFSTLPGRIPIKTTLRWFLLPQLRVARQSDLDRRVRVPVLRHRYGLPSHPLQQQGELPLLIRLDGRDRVIARARIARVGLLTVLRHRAGRNRPGTRRWRPDLR